MSESMQYSNRKLSDEAKRLEELGQFAQAADLYKQSYDLYPGSFVTSHYIRCLREIGKSAEAVKFGRQLSRQLREDPFVHKKLSWAMYDVYLKKAESMEDNEFDDVEHEQHSNPDFQKMQEAARYILSRASAEEDILRTRTIFAICNEAKQRGSWQVMYDFAVQLAPESLSTEQREWNGQKLIPDYQNWLHKMAKSLFELKRYEECVNFVQRGIEKYPRDKQFFWLKASAQKALGQIEEALHELEQLDLRFSKEWYIQSEIADIYVQLQKYDEAKVWYCKAASCSGDPKFRYKMFEQIAALFEHMGYLQAAFDHLQLAYAITERELWERSAAELRGKLVRFKRQHAEDSTTLVETPPVDISRLRRRCEALWQEMLALSHPSSRGQVVTLNEEKGFGFIRRNDGSGKDVYFKFRALARGLTPEIGMIVEFEIEESFDLGKSQESQAAVNIRQVRGSV